MWIECENDCLLQSDKVREFGLHRYTIQGYTLESQLSPDWRNARGIPHTLYDVFAYGVGESPEYSNEHRYLKLHCDEHEAHALLAALFAALKKNDAAFSAIEFCERYRAKRKRELKRQQTHANN